MPDPDPSELRRLLRQYRSFARHEIPAQGSPTYAAICEGLADDPDRAGLALRAQPAFRTPLILLAAVHHLLLGGAHHRLAEYYPSVAGAKARAVDDGLYPAFAGFVDAHRAEVVRLVASRSTQTNEAGRTVITLPALGLVQGQSTGPLALLEVGASAGLNLLPDRYGYRVGDRVAGDRASALQIDCSVEGDLRPPIPERPLPIGWRIGMDLNPLDVRDPATRAWLRALVWPEHTDRMASLDAALEVARRDPPLVIRGDLTSDLPAATAEAPPDTNLVIASTWVLAYVGEPQRLELLDSLRRIAADADRSVWLVACEAESVLVSLGLGLGEAPPEGYGQSTLSLHRFDPGGGGEHRLLAACQAHGRWIRWLEAASAAGPA